MTPTSEHHQGECPSIGLDCGLTHPSLVSLPLVIQRLKTLAEANLTRRMAIWGNRIAAVGPQRCQRHPRQALDIDLERSLYECDKVKNLVVVHIECPDCQADAERQRRERNLIRRGIPARSIGITFETWDSEWEPQAAGARREAFLKARDWTQGRPPVPFLIIIGSTFGTGKTALGVAALRAFGSDVRCLDFRDWINGMISMDSSDRAGAIESIRGYSALMIDDIGNRDIGANNNGGNAMERDSLAAVLNHRFENRLPTIMTSNLSGAEFKSRFDPRTIDRIRAGRVLIDASDWPSRRAAEGI